MSEPPLGAISTKTVGFMGESLTALLLELEFGGRGLRVIKVGSEDVEWDLFLLDAPEDSPFGKYTVIQVKARDRYSSYWTYPTREELLRTRRAAGDAGYELWYSFIHYGYEEGHLMFGVYLVPADRIREEDFRMRREFGRDVDMLKITTMRGRAPIKYRSRRMEIEERQGAEDPSPDTGGREDTIPLRVSKDQAGDWGEYMARFLIESEYKSEGLMINRLCNGYNPYDMFIDRAVEGTPFGRRAAISVKANSTDNTFSKPSFEELTELREDLEAHDIQLWLALLQTYYADRELRFGMYLIDSGVLDRDDFQDYPGSQLRPNLLSFVRGRKKATLRLWSEDMAESRITGDRGSVRDR